MQRVAIVTGAARGIGLAVAQRLVADGLQVALLDRDEAATREAAASLGESAQPFICDIADSASVNATIAAVVARWGRIDVLVNNAGIVGPNKPLIEVGDEEWARVVAINLNGAFYCCRAAAPEMLKHDWGRIVNIASIAGKEGNPNASAYSAAKAGLIALTKSLGKETADQDIAVNVITPAAAKTQILEQVSQTHIDYMLSKIPRGRFVTVEEIAALVCFLASRENSFTTGAVFDISGGRATY